MLLSAIVRCTERTLADITRKYSDNTDNTTRVSMAISCRSEGLAQWVLSLPQYSSIPSGRHPWKHVRDDQLDASGRSCK